MEKHPSSIHQIRFQDCDPLSHLNNGRYFDYFMSAREDQLANFYGLHIYDRLKKSGESWVVARSEIEYRYPAFLMEKVLITTQVNSYSLKHVEVEMAMYDESKKRLKALLRTVFIPFSVVLNKVTEHDAELMELLKSVCAEVDQGSMEHRLSVIEGKLK
ncbi:MAG: acyl-CoA thioesterase [Vicingaceae bacterium]